jgi:hypothetical protein
MQEVSMNRFNKSLASTFLSASMLFTGSLQAMEIRQFDKMADSDLKLIRRVFYPPIRPA